ncbi:MAG: sugar-binding domain-containing protein [Terracidiphilus sp.]|jgi:beta-galactosidase
MSQHRHLSRRAFLGSAAITAVGLPVLFGKWQPTFAAALGDSFVPPESPRRRLNFDLDWKFVREDVPGAETLAFDDSKWITISTPHTFNDVDSFRTIISHGGGDRGTYKGLSWYRKHFKLPANLSGRKVFLEFEGMRQAGDIYLNGRQIGLYENGVTPYGIDISGAVNLGAHENVLAVKVDNRTNYAERGTGTTFEWNANDFNPDYGGINRHVSLHVTGKIYQTLPLYCGLNCSGVYVHAANFNISKKTADVTVESEVCNESGERATVVLSAIIVDRNGQVCARLNGDSVDMVDGEKSVLTASTELEHAEFWSTEHPCLYDVHSILMVDGKTVDANKVVTGFRKTEFKGGAGTGGVYINDKFVYLKGYAQRSSNEWAGLGQAYPDWMHDLNAKLIHDSHANYVRWMHVAPQKVDADSFARYGIIQICPAGDKERDAAGRQWEQRLDVMRASMIYFRNNPSILFWEAGNTVVTVEHMKQMVALREQWDLEGGRLMGDRDNDDAPANTSLTPVAEFYEVMIAQDPKTDTLAGPTDIFRGYSAERRDRAPLIEAEDFREEGARRFWDDYSPPYYRAKKGPNDTWRVQSTYLFTSESFALAGVRRYWEYWQNRISNSDPAHSKWSGYASIYFSDSDADGRQDSSEVCRVSGKVDAVRLPKEIYYAHRVMQNEQPDLHILGHWSYPLEQSVSPEGPAIPGRAAAPSRPPMPDQPAIPTLSGHRTVKTVYVVANTESVELILNGKSLGINAKPENGFVFAFPEVYFVPGSLKAVARYGGKIVAEEELSTAGPATQIKLTAIIGPKGLEADGEDVALIDVEVLDAKGQRVPTDDARIEFTISGSGVWRGGYNSGKIESTNNLFLNTELGINRVSVRSTRTAGTITVTASRPGLKSAQVQIVTKPVSVVEGFAAWIPQHLRGPAEE